MSILGIESFPGVFDNLDILNLHFIKGIPIFLFLMPCPLVGEGKEASAVAHLAYARTQNSGNGILGCFKEKGIMHVVIPFLGRKETGRTRVFPFRGGKGYISVLDLREWKINCFTIQTVFVFASLCLHYGTNIA